MKVYLKLVALVLSFVICLSFFGCEKGDKEYQKDIVYTEDTPPSLDLGKRAEEVFFSLLKYYVSKSGATNIPEKTLDRLQAVSKDIRDIIDKSDISDYSYGALLDLLEDKGCEVIDEIKDGEGIRAAREIYLDICNLLGERYIGNLSYELLLYYYDYSYRDYIEKFEKYGYQYLFDDADKMRVAGEILKEEIGAESFCSVLASGLALAEIMTFEPGDGAELSFSDEELLLFVQKLDFSFEISDRGWEYILGTLLVDILDESSREILLSMVENGDIKVISSSMGDILTFLRIIQSGLSTSDMSLIREGDREGLVTSTFASLNEEGWDMFFKITEVTLNTEYYDTLFESEYCEDYIEYRDNLDIISGEELKSAAGTDQFYESLERYIGGISPAFSYGMNR